MDAYELRYPEGYEELSWEYKAKGWIAGVILLYGGAEYVLNIYEPERLRQDVEDELQGSSVFFEPNLLVVPVVDRPSIKIAIERLISRGDVAISMCPSTRKSGLDLPR